MANCDTLCRRLTVIKTDRCDYSEAFPKISTHSLLPSSRHKNKKVYKYIYTLQYFPKKTLAYFCVSQSGYVKVKHVYCFCFWQLTASFLVVFAPHTKIYYVDLLENKIGLAIMAAILLLWKYYLHILQVCLSSFKQENCRTSFWGGNTSRKLVMKKVNGFFFLIRFYIDLYIHTSFKLISLHPYFSIAQNQYS